MRIAIISDTHFGDKMCTLVERVEDGTLVMGPKYGAFKEAVGSKNDYLILLGDIFDFSIEKYHEAYEIGKAFFLKIQEDEIATEIIFVPGNHDADLWHTVEHEINTIYQIKNGRHPRRFRMSVPGVIDARAKSQNPGFTLPGVTAKSASVEPNPKQPKYAGLFLDHLTKPEGKATTFNFAYPNVYMVTDKESVLITHGHYLERYWAMGGEWAMKIAHDDLQIGDTLELDEMVGLNFPLSQLACSGIGQAGPLTKVASRVQREIKDGNLKRIEKYLDRLDNEIDALTRFPWYKHYLEWLTDAISNNVKKMVLKLLATTEETRFNKEFIHKKEVRERFGNFYRASLIEIAQLKLKYGYNIPTPQYVIFGHTHQPTSWGDENAPKTNPMPNTGNPPVKLFNAGGWLNRLNEKKQVEFCGAEVFTYRTEEGFKSTSIK